MKNKEVKTVKDKKIPLQYIDFDENEKNDPAELHLPEPQSDRPIKGKELENLLASYIELPLDNLDHEALVCQGMRWDMLTIESKQVIYRYIQRHCSRLSFNTIEELYPGIPLDHVFNLFDGIKQENNQPEFLTWKGIKYWPGEEPIKETEDTLLVKVDAACDELVEMLYGHLGMQRTEDIQSRWDMIYDVLFKHRKEEENKSLIVSDKIAPIKYEWITAL